MCDCNPLVESFVGKIILGGVVTQNRSDFYLGRVNWPLWFIVCLVEKCAILCAFRFYCSETLSLIQWDQIIPNLYSQIFFYSHIWIWSREQIENWQFQSDGKRRLPVHEHLDEFSPSFAGSSV